MCSKKRRKHSFILMILLLGCLLTLTACGEFIEKEPPDPWANIAYSVSLTDSEKTIIKNVYDSRAVWETKQDAESEHLTRNPLDIYAVQWIYDGNTLFFAPQYMYLDTSQYAHVGVSTLQSVYEIDSLGNLTLTSVDAITFTDTVAGFIRYTHGTVSRGAVFTTEVEYTKEMSEEEKLSALCDSYIKYTSIRHSVFGNLDPISEVDFSGMTSEQKKLYDSLLVTMSTWEIKEINGDYFSCDSFKIWHFGDGTAEMYCYYPEIKNMGSSSGTSDAYAIEGSSISKLSDDAEDRLQRDLQDHSEQSWSIYWTDAKKESVLFKYIVSNF